MDNMEEIKTLVVDGNRAIEALRAEKKSDDVLTQEKMGRIEADLAETLAQKQAAELAQKALEIMTRDKLDERSHRLGEALKARLKATAKALKAPIRAPETPKPINPRAITSDQTSFPKLNNIAPVAATRNKILWTFLAPNLSSRTPNGN